MRKTVVGNSSEKGRANFFHSKRKRGEFGHKNVILGMVLSHDFSFSLWNSKRAMLVN